MKHFNGCFVRWSRVLRIGLGLAGAAILLPGCGQAPAAPTPDQRQASVETQIQTIQNDPKMSPQSKQSAINALQARRPVAQ